MFGHAFWSFASPSAAPKEYLHEGKGYVSSSALSPDGDVLALGLGTGNLVIWDMAAKKARSRVDGQGYVFVLASIDPARGACFAGTTTAAAPDV